MRLFPTAAVLAAGALISGCAAMGPGGDTAPVARAATFDAGRLSEHVRVLADDSFQGRGIAIALGQGRPELLQAAEVAPVGALP